VFTLNFARCAHGSNNSCVKLQRQCLIRVFINPGNSWNLKLPLSTCGKSWNTYSHESHEITTHLQCVSKKKLLLLSDYYQIMSPIYNVH